MLLHRTEYVEHIYLLKMKVPHSKYFMYMFRNVLPLYVDVMVTDIHDAHVLKLYITFF